MDTLAMKIHLLFPIMLNTCSLVRMV